MQWQRLLQLCKFCSSIATVQVLLSVIVMLVDLFVAVMHVIASVAITLFKVCTALMQVTVSSSKMWVTIFVVFMEVAVCCNYAGGYFGSAQLLLL